MELNVWAAFAAACFIIAVISGPGVASIVGFALSSGRAAALASVVGMACGNAAAMVLSLAGAATLLATSAFAFAMVKWIGAAYLIIIGVNAIAKSRDTSRPNYPAGQSPRTVFLSTVAVGLFHPKTILFFIAFATQFIDPTRPYLPQAVVLVLTFTGVAAITDTAYALAASRASGLLSRGAIRLWAQRAGGGVLMAAGVATAAMRR